MPDYTSILRRSISALPDSRPEMREAVYQRARAALARQLTAVDPPLSTREIERQHQELETAVTRLEAEYVPRAEPEASAPFVAKREERPVYRPERPAAAVPRAEPKPVASPPPPPPAARPDHDYDADDEDESDEFDEDESGSRLPLLIGLALAILVIGGLGVYGYEKQDRVLSLLGLSNAGGAADAGAGEASPTGAQVATVDDQPAIDAAAGTGVDKLPDRLTNGADTPPTAGEPTADEQAAPDAALNLPANEDSADATGTAAEFGQPAPSEAPISTEQQTAALEPPGQSLVAQRAIYYFQGAQGQPGKATEGTVAWAQVNRDSGPAVQATLKMAGQDVTTTVTIYKNNDTTLPASHLVEIQFSGALGPSPVQRVPALVLKQTEQARGQPLTGAAVPVTGELFWIALSNDSEQVKRNIQLLREGSWFDVPILFNDGTRALLTFEKGIPGDKVFETVISAWTPS